MDQETRDPNGLRPHPLNATIYGEPDADPAFVESIREEGIIVPLTIDQDDNIISGHRRWYAALALGLDRVPVVVRAITDPLDAIRLLIEANRQRARTYSQRMREADEWAGVLSAQSQTRMSEAGRQGGQLAGRGRPLADPIGVAPNGATPIGEEVDAATERYNERRNRTFQRERYIWHIAGERGGDADGAAMVARELVKKLDATTITVFRAEQELRDAVEATERRAALPPEPMRPVPARSSPAPVTARPDPWGEPDADPEVGLYSRPVAPTPEWPRPAPDPVPYVTATPPPLDEHAALSDTILGADAAINDGGVAKHLLLSKLGRDVRHLLLTYKEDEVCAALERYPELDHIFTDLHRLRRMIANVERCCTVIRGGQGVG